MQEPLFEMFRGDDYALNLTITDDADTPIDVTGWRFWATLKLSSEMPDEEAPVKVDLSAQDGTGATQGLVNILLPHDQTANLMPTRYMFDVQAEHEGMITTVVSGTVQVKGDVTWRTA